MVPHYKWATPATTTVHLQSQLTTAAIHPQPPPTTVDHSMDPNPNVLLNDNGHIASNVHKDLYKIVRPRLHHPGYFPGRRVIPYLNVAGFGVAARSSDWDWKSAPSVGHLRAVTWKAIYENNGRLLPSTAVLSLATR
ncbi:hypothetical protein GOBAR_DD29571 [Gossypium barbadense]|nr:hypothetical protein GOBAR_DD29571 [Gossypium barbadense]